MNDLDKLAESVSFSEVEFKELREHCIHVWRLLAEAEPFYWEQVAEWLQVAACVKGIDLELPQYSSGMYMCSAADEFDSSREKLLTEFLRHLSVFQFVWGALECAAIATIGSTLAAKGGKILALCRQLGSAYRSRRLPDGYLQAIGRLRDAASEQPEFCGLGARLAEGTVDPGIGGVGLHAVYTLRNKFAHGDLNFPLPDENNEPVAPNASVVESATRLVLLSIQMLAVLKAPDVQAHPIFELTPDDENDFEFEQDGVPMSWRLRSCHIELRRR